MIKNQKIYSEGGILGMLSPLERKKCKSLAKSILSSNADTKKYEEIYLDFANNGYTEELCEEYANSFVNNIKKPLPEDVIQLASLYDRIHDYKSAGFYLEVCDDLKMNNDERFAYCVERLKNASKLGHWHNAADFRTANISFIQNYVKKKPPQALADMYISLALVDCAAKNYDDAFKLLRFGYKPTGRNDTKLLEILITGVYICACSQDTDSLSDAVNNANSCLKLFSEFEFPWKKEYYENRIRDAANGVL